MSDSLFIYGCGGHARSVADVAFHNGYQAITFIDPNAQPNEKSLGFEVKTHFPSDLQHGVIVGIGDNQRRADAFAFLLKNKMNVITLIANDAHIGIKAQLGLGVFVARAVHVGPNAVIQTNTLLNTRCIIEHDVQIGHHCHVSVNAIIAGKSRIGDCVMVGANATIIDSVNVCSNVIIGAGSVVVNDIDEPGIYVGVPARALVKK